MKIITNVELSLGYQHWKKLMLENEKFRQENQIQLLAYGHEEGNENKAGAIIETQKMIKLVE